MKKAGPEQSIPGLLFFAQFCSLTQREYAGRI